MADILLPILTYEDSDVDPSTSLPAGQPNDTKMPKIECTLADAGINKEIVVDKPHKEASAEVRLAEASNTASTVVAVLASKAAEPKADVSCAIPSALVSRFPDVSSCLVSTPPAGTASAPAAPDADANASSSTSSASSSSPASSPTSHDATNDKTTTSTSITATSKAPRAPRPSGPVKAPLQPKANPAPDADADSEPADRPLPGDSDEVDFEARRRRAVFTAMLLLLDRGARDPDHLSHLVAAMSGEELQQVAEERALAGRCGNPLCDATHFIARPPPRRRWDPDAGFIEPPPPSHFCSASCELLVESYARQLGDPLERLRPDVRQLLAASHARRRPGLENVAAQGGGVATMMADVRERDPRAAEAEALAGGRALDQMAAEAAGTDGAAAAVSGRYGAVEGYMPNGGKQRRQAAATTAATAISTTAAVADGGTSRRAAGTASGEAAAPPALKPSLRKQSSAKVTGAAYPGADREQKRVTFGPQVEYQMPTSPDCKPASVARRARSALLRSGPRSSPAPPPQPQPQPQQAQAQAEPQPQSQAEQARQVPGSQPQRPQPPELQPPELQPPELQPPELQPLEPQPPELQPPELQPPELQPPELQPPELQPPEQQLPQPLRPEHQPGPQAQQPSPPGAQAQPPSDPQPLQPLLVFEVEEGDGVEAGSGVGDGGQRGPGRHRGPVSGPLGTLRVVESAEVLQAAAAAEEEDEEEGVEQEEARRLGAGGGREGRGVLTDEELVASMRETGPPFPAVPRALRMWFPPAAGGLGISKCGGEGGSGALQRQTKEKQQQQAAQAAAPSCSSASASAVTGAGVSATPHMGAKAQARPEPLTQTLTLTLTQAETSIQAQSQAASGIQPVARSSGLRRFIPQAPPRRKVIYLDTLTPGLPAEGQGAGPAAWAAVRSVAAASSLPVAHTPSGAGGTTPPTSSSSAPSSAAQPSAAQPSAAQPSASATRPVPPDADTPSQEELRPPGALIWPDLGAQGKLGAGLGAADRTAVGCSKEASPSLSGEGGVAPSSSVAANTTAAARSHGLASAAGGSSSSSGGGGGTDRWAPWAPPPPGGAAGPPKVHVVHIRSDKRPAGGGVPIPPESQPYFSDEEEEDREDEQEEMYDERFVHDDRDADEMADDLYAGTLRGLDDEEEEEGEGEGEKGQDRGSRTRAKDGERDGQEGRGDRTADIRRRECAGPSTGTELLSCPRRLRAGKGATGAGGGSGGGVAASGSLWKQQQQQQQRRRQRETAEAEVAEARREPTKVTTGTVAMVRTPTPTLTPEAAGSVASVAAATAQGVEAQAAQPLSSSSSSSSSAAAAAVGAVACADPTAIVATSPASGAVDSPACQCRRSSSTTEVLSGQPGSVQAEAATEAAVHCDGGGDDDDGDGDGWGLEPWMLRDDLDTDESGTEDKDDETASNTSSADDYNYKSMLPFFHRTTQHYHMVLSPYNQLQTALVGWVNSRTVAFVVGIGLGPLRDPGPALPDAAYSEEGAEGVPDPSALQSRGVLLQLLGAPLRECCGALRVRVPQSDVDRKLTALVSTFRLSGPVPSFKPAQWHLLCLALLFALSRHHIPALRASLCAQPQPQPSSSSSSSGGMGGPEAGVADHHEGDADVSGGDGHGGFSQVSGRGGGGGGDVPVLRAGGGLRPHPRLLALLQRTGFDVHYLEPLVDLLTAPDF